MELAVSVAGAGVARFVAVDVAPAAVVVAAPVAEAATTDSPRTVAAATATSLPRREMDVLRSRSGIGADSHELQGGEWSDVTAEKPASLSSSRATVLSSTVSRSMTMEERRRFGQSRRNSATRKARSRDWRAFNRGSHAVV